MLKPKSVLLYTGLFCALIALMLGLVTAAACIPRAAIDKNLTSVAEYYKSRDMFELWDENDEMSLVHNYADAVLFNIIAGQDSARPLESALDAAFYQNKNQSQGANLYDAAVNGKAPDTSYARYWHGMAVLLKPLLLVTDLNGIRIAGAAVLLALGAVYFALLWRRKMRAALVSSAAGLILCQVWLVPICIEYYACFALMLLFADLILWRYERLRHEALVFLFAGALTCFFDFLTCEILTLCVPLALLLWLRRDGGREGFRRAAGCCGAWLLGYAGTWLAKWLLAALVLGYGISDVALGQGALRAAGEVALPGIEMGFQPLAAIVVNIYCLFPFKYLHGAAAIWLAFGVLCLLLFCFWFLYRKEPDERRGAGLFFLLALVPFVRYAVISNHSALHPFMTYRDLLISIVAVSMGLAMSVRVKRAKPAGKKGGRKLRN